MATKKKAASRKTSRRPSSSGSDPKSKGLVKKKMQETMHEFKHHDLESGRSGKKVKNPKQAIAIGLSEARRSGAKIPPSPNKRSAGGTAKKASKKTGSSRSAARKAPATKTPSRRAPQKKAGAKKAAPRKTAGRKAATKRKR